MNISLACYTLLAWLYYVYFLFMELSRRQEIYIGLTFSAGSLNKLLFSTFIFSSIRIILTRTLTTLLFSFQILLLIFQAFWWERQLFFLFLFKLHGIVLFIATSIFLHYFQSADKWVVMWIEVTVSINSCLLFYDIVDLKVFAHTVFSFLLLLFWFLMIFILFFDDSEWLHCQSFLCTQLLRFDKRTEFNHFTMRFNISHVLLNGQVLALK